MYHGHRRELTVQWNQYSHCDQVRSTLLTQSTLGDFTF